jgi:hypothetical protein
MTDAVGSAWMDAVGSHMRDQSAHGSANVKTEFQDGKPVKTHLTDAITIRPGTPLAEAAASLAALLVQMADQGSNGGPESSQVAIVVKLSARDGRIGSAEVSRTVTLNLLEHVDGRSARL